MFRTLKLLNSVNTMLHYRSAPLMFYYISAFSAAANSLPVYWSSTKRIFILICAVEPQRKIIFSH